MATELASTATPDFISTVDADTYEGKIKVVSALNGADSLEELGDKTIVVSDILETQGVRSRTGEVCTNTYLIDSDGHAYFTQSDGIKKSVDFILMAFNGKLPEDGIPCQVKSQKLNNGNTLKTLVPVVKK